MKVLLENLLRNEDGRTVTKEDIQAVAAWLKTKSSEREIAFRPARVLMQDFTGVPAVVDLAAMRDAMTALGGDPKKINPLVPVDLVIDHSVIVNFFGNDAAFKKNVDEEYKQNQERYKFLKWAQKAFENFRVVPPGTGICHQVNLEYLSQTVWTGKDKVKIDGKEATAEVAYPDTLVGTDSHTTMVNGTCRARLGRRRHRGGSRDARPAALHAAAGSDRLQAHRQAEGRHDRDRSRADGDADAAQARRGRTSSSNSSVPALDNLSIADRATIGNMAPEYGATCGFFPIDDETVDYLRDTGRKDDRVKLVEAYAKAQGMFRAKTTPDPVFTDMLKLDLGIGRAVARRAEASAGSRAAQGREDPASPRRWTDEFKKAARTRQARAGAGPQARSRPWRRRDRRHHLLHQHLQSERDDRRRACWRATPRRRA